MQALCCCSANHELHTLNLLSTVIIVQRNIGSRSHCRLKCKIDSSDASILMFNIDRDVAKMSLPRAMTVLSPQPDIGVGFIAAVYELLHDMN